GHADPRSEVPGAGAQQDAAGPRRTAGRCRLGNRPGDRRERRTQPLGRGRSPPSIFVGIRDRLGSLIGIVLGLGIRVGIAHWIGLRIPHRLRRWIAWRLRWFREPRRGPDTLAAHAAPPAYSILSPI